jgi:hypothetical protein
MYLFLPDYLLLAEVVPEGENGLGDRLLFYYNARENRIVSD